MKGLSTEEALRTLIEEIKETVSDHEASWNASKYKDLLRQSLSSHQESR